MLFCNKGEHVDNSIKFNDLINLHSENSKGCLAQGNFFINQTFHLCFTIWNPNLIKSDWKLLTHDVAWWPAGSQLVVSAQSHGQVFVALERPLGFAEAYICTFGINATEELKKQLKNKNDVDPKRNYFKINLLFKWHLNQSCPLTIYFLDRIRAWVLVRQQWGERTAAADVESTKRVSVTSPCSPQQELQCSTN